MQCHQAIAALPLYHIFALTLCLLAIRQGSHLTLVPNPRDFGKFIETLKSRPFHLLPGVNTLFNALLQHPMFKTIDFSNLCLTQAGGMAASEGTARAWQAATGSAMIEGWGMSETCAIGTNNPVTQTSFSGSIGLPLPSIDMAIKDEQGNSLAQGESGEICIRGPNVMVGYYKQEEETRKAFTPDGFMRTGDIFGLADQTYRVSGDTSLERVSEAFDVKLNPDVADEDTHQFDTIGGLVAHEMGHVPKRGEKFSLSGLDFVVLHTRGGAVRWFKVSPTPASKK